MTTRRQRRKILDSVLAYLFVGVWLLPFYGAILGSLTPASELGSRDILPRHFHYQNYVEALSRNDLVEGLLNSGIYAVSITAVVLVLAVPAAYATSRFRFAGRRAYMFGLLWTQMLPQVLLILPLFLMMRSFGLLDSRWAVIITAAAVSLPLPTWLLKGYFDTVPIELDQAALIDGCGYTRALVSVVLPAALPGLLTALMLLLTIGWGQFLIPLVMLFDDSKQPVTVTVFRLMSEHVVPWHLVMAATVIAAGVSTLVFSVLQRYVTGGFTAGAIKS